MRKIQLSIALSCLFITGTAKAQVVYNDDIQPIFNSNCIACHGGTSGVTLSSYQAVMNSVGHQFNQNIVVPGSADDSPIVEKIEPNPSIGARMPEGGPFLSENEINLIRQWIDEGALETPATDAADAGSTHPDRFQLLGNYPNPFNPATNVRFELPQPASWSVTIYNTSGQYITEESGWSQAGEVSVSVNLESNSSGMYLYVVEMRANESVSGRLAGNMLLIK